MPYRAKPEVDEILKLLRTTPVGGVVTYKEVSALVGQRVHSGFSPLRTARKHALTNGLLFDPMPNIGYRRLDANGAVRVAGAKMTSVRRKARHGTRVLDTTRNANDLDLNNQAVAAHLYLRFEVIAKISGMHGDKGVEVSLAEGTVNAAGLVQAVTSTVANMLKHRDDG